MNDKFYRINMKNLNKLYSVIIRRSSYLEDDCTITTMFGWWGIAAIVICGFFIGNTYAIQEIKFDKTEIMIEHGAILEVTFTERANNNLYNERIETGEITIYNSAEMVGNYQFILTEYEDSGFFTSPMLVFSSSINDPNNHKYLVPNVPLNQNSPYSVVGKATVDSVTYTTGQIQIINEEQAISPLPNKINSVLYSCSSFGGDSDGDGLCANWEKGSTLEVEFPAGSSVKYVFSCTAAPCTDNQKDMFIEIDYMKGHRPSSLALKQFTDAINSMGVNVHIQLDEFDYTKIKHSSSPGIRFPGMNVPTYMKGYDSIKEKFFGTPVERGDINGVPSSDWTNTKKFQKRLAFHYILFVHSQYQSTSSGAAEILGNDAIISLGAFDGRIGNIYQQSGTLMHEIGHNLNLDHAGVLPTPNCKPLYLSVMNYLYQFPDIVNDRPLRFSHQTVNLGDGSILNENGVPEAVGVQPYTPNQKFAFGPGIPFIFQNTGTIPVKWNNNDRMDEVVIEKDLNSINSALGIVCQESTYQALAGFNDLERPLVWSGEGNSNYADGRIASGTGAGQAVVGSGTCPHPEDVKRVLRVEEPAAVQRVCAGGTSADVTPDIVRISNLIEGVKKRLAEQPTIQYVSEIEQTIASLEQAIENGQSTQAMNTLRNFANSAPTNLDPMIKIMLNDATNTMQDKYLLATSKEITSEEVVKMRVARIESLENELKKGYVQYSGNKNDVLETYAKELTIVKKHIVNNDMSNAIDGLILIRKTYDNKDNDDRVTNLKAKVKLLHGTDQILKSFYKATNEYAVLQHNVPPLAQTKIGADVLDIYCHNKVALLRVNLKVPNSSPVLCVSDDTATALVAKGSFKLAPSKGVSITHSP